MPHERLRNLVRPSALLVLLLVSSLLAGAAAQSYEWRDVEQVAEIQADGSVIVYDTRTLWTDDDFGEAFICFDLEGREAIELLPGSGAVSQGPPATAFAQSCSVGTELVVRNETRVSERRVRFVYRLTGATEYYSDVAQFYWNMVQLDHPVILGYSLTVTAPGPMEFPYDAYVHRYFNIEQPRVSLSGDRSTLTVEFERIPSGSGVEIRYLMDPSLFTQKSTAPGMERLLEDEAKVAGIDEDRVAMARFRSHPLWALLPLAVLTWLGSSVLRTYRRVGREPPVESMKYPFEPPTDRPPAAVTAMMMQSFNSAAMGPAFQATIMELARKGYGEFKPKGSKFEMQLNLQMPVEHLNPLEASILGYLKNAAKTHRKGDPSFLEFTELKSYSQRYASSFMPKWSKYVRDWIEKELGGPLVDAASQKLANRWFGLSWVGVALAGGTAIFVSGPGRIAGIVVAIACFVLSFVAAGSIPAWRPEVAREVYGWQGFKRTLSDYTRMKDAPLDFYKLWDKYYVYAAALGVAEQYLKALRKAAPLKGIDESAMIRQASWMGVSHGSISSLAGLSSSISSLSSALSAASASASSGGSSSGGGGGGGGGGSSGGR
ncbi:MAG TPA: DUF2207 domain-containing protein [Trueperaceae bacterium]|nr:DUF2207 domain-containing protein [Trueperaceae bacterium]